VLQSGFHICKREGSGCRGRGIWQNNFRGSCIDSKGYDKAWMIVLQIHSVFTCGLFNQNNSFYTVISFTTLQTSSESQIHHPSQSIPHHGSHPRDYPLPLHLLALCKKVCHILSLNISVVVGFNADARSLGLYGTSTSEESHTRNV
jgi:hypothetical protein